MAKVIDDYCWSCHERVTECSCGETETFGCESPICPHCAQLHVIDDDHHLWDDGNHTIECGHCCLKFFVQTHVSHTFTANRKDPGKNG